MKKLISTLVVLFVLVAAAVIVGPSLVDWNDYKGEISTQVRAATGRDMAIRGDIRIEVLPAPALVAHDVSVANPQGATSPYFARLKSIEVRVALGPLLGGQVKVETVRLIEPVVEMEVLADGRKTWEFEKPTGNVVEVPPPPGQAADQSAASRLPAVVLDHFAIENGTVVYRDAEAGVVERLERLDARVAAASLIGPFESEGSLTARGVPLSYNVNVGEVIHDRTIPFSLNLGVAAGNVKAQVTGALLGLADEPRFKGRAKGEGDSLAGVLGLVMAGTELPAGLSQDFGFEGSVTATAAAAEVKDLTLRLGQTQASGDLALELGDTLNVAARLAANRFDLDAWLAPPTAEAAKAGAGNAAEAIGQRKATAALPAPSSEPRPPGFALPESLGGSMILSVDTMNYRGGLIRDVVLNAELANGEATISQFSAQIPGGADVAMFGFMSERDGATRFEGEVEATVSDLRGVLGWLGFTIDGVSSDRLRKLSLATQLVATPKQVQLGKLDLRFDSSRLTGAATVALRKRPSFGVNLVLDRIDADAYLPKPPDQPAEPEKPGTAAAPPAAQEQAAKVAETDLFKPLGALKQLDANVKAHVKTLAYGGTQIKDVVVDGTLYNGELDIRRLSVAKAAGASARVSGKLTGLGGIPTMKGLKFETSTKDLSRLLRVAGIESPVDPRKLGAVSIKGRADGSPLKPKLDATVTAAGATVGLKGWISPLPVGDMMDAAVRVRHKDLARLLRALGVDYRPSGKIGGIDLAAQVRGGPAALVLGGMRGKVGTVTLKGVAAIDLAGAVPKLTADIVTGALAIDAFLPAKRGAALAPARGLVPRLVPAAWPGPGGRAGDPLLQVAAVRGVWPADPLDLSALRAFDAEVTLKAPVVVYQRYLLEKADIAAELKAGVLTTRRLKGEVFGGTMDGQARIDARATNRIQADVKVAAIDVAEATRSLSGKPIADGRLTVDLSVIAQGRSVADLVSTLNGSGTMTLLGIDARGATQGTALAGPLGLVSALGQLGGGRGGAQADIRGTFNIDRGIARSNDIQLVSGFGDGAAAGAVDLPNWRIDMAGQVRLADNLLTQILKAKIRETRNAVPFTVKGRLDAPDINIDTGALLGAGVPIPGADALLNKAPKGIGGLLKGILGGQQQQQQQQPPPPTGQTQQQPPPPPPQQQQKLDPNQLLKDLFKL